MFDIKIIAMGSEKTTANHVTFTDTGKAFVLGVPDSVLEECAKRGIDATFFTSTAPAFYGHENLAALERASGISGLAKTVEATVMNRAGLFMGAIEKARESNRPSPFNGPGLGVSRILTSRTPDAYEIPGMEIGIHDTNYFTMSVMNDVWKILRRRGESALADDRLQDMPQAGGKDLGFFFNSFGLNTSVVLGNQYIVGIRPNGQRHVAMNEGLRRDSTEALPTLASLYQRGMREELGISDAPVEGLRIRELFIWESMGQMGLHAVARLDMSIGEFKARQERAVDRWKNEKLSPVPFARSVMVAMANNQACATVPYTRGLWQGLSYNL